MTKETGSKPLCTPSETPVTHSRFLYRRIGFDERPLELLRDGRIGDGAADCERFWRLDLDGHGLPILTIAGSSQPTFRVRWDDKQAIWTGRWLNHERMVVELLPLARRAPEEPMRRILIQSAVGDEHERMLEATLEHHAAYCTRHGLGYRTDSTMPARRSPHWRKVELLLEAMADGYDQAAWLDADCVIVRPDYNLFSASGFGIAVCECFDSPSIERHLNTGFLLATKSDETIAFLNAWNKSPPGGTWEDQTAFISLMAGRPYRDLLTVLPNRFNEYVREHMEARDPFIRAFHGDQARATAVPKLVREVTGLAL